MKLIDTNGKIVTNSNRIEVELSLFTTEHKPRELLLNHVGDKIIKRNKQSNLINGFSCFSKVQINAVTSHFPYGRVFLVIKPTTTQDQFNINRPNKINPTMIQPFVMDNLIVKAKKIKRKNP